MKKVKIGARYQRQEILLRLNFIAKFLKKVENGAKIQLRPNASKNKPKRAYNHLNIKT